MENQYDDALLQTTENLANIDYDSLDSFGMLSAGKHLVVIEQVSGYLHNFKDYTGPRAKFKMRVVEGASPADVGKYQYDDLNLPHAAEKQGNQNRRVLIATHLGLVPKGTKDVTKINWKDLVGTSAVITVEHREGANGKKYANVTFDGYENQSTWNAPQGGNGEAKQDTWDDI